jgi:hypothetical protein
MSSGSESGLVKLLTAAAGLLAAVLGMMQFCSGTGVREEVKVEEPTKRVSQAQTRLAQDCCTGAGVCRLDELLPVESQCRCVMRTSGATHNGYACHSP